MSTKITLAVSDFLPELNTHSKDYVPNLPEGKEIVCNKNGLINDKK